MSFLKGLDGSEMITPTQVQANHHVANVVPKPVGEVGNDAFFHHLLGSVMIGKEHDMLTKFLKLKPPIFFGSETEDAYEFILDCYERFHYLGITHQHGLSSCHFNFKVKPINGGELICNAEHLHYL